MAKIKKLLVANRGEIALRIMRSAQEMGIKTVAVFSEADRQALHVRFADEAVCIGPPPSAQSYLVMDKIIAAAHETQVDAIHPGYGFLSENEDFARRVKEAGLIFVGPSAESMEIMGSKLGAKAAVSKFNVPLVPGTAEPVTDVSVAKIIAKEIGYPVLIKASAGGGGKGMRIVTQENELQEQMERAISEATSAFGDGSVFIEKYVSEPRHIEFQIFGDQHGNVVHLFERECSIQRRHQKVIEEAPSSILTPELRKKMGEAAVNAAKAANYYNAGTIEFILDEKMNFYFLEMNTRLQVEHPVTEQITGLDLVKLQIKIAEGEKLPFRQEDLKIHGHAIEVRVYAEDPANNFLPDIGTLKTYRRPQGHGIRVDDGFEQGMSIPFYYDPMIAKMICHDETRERAIEKTIRAIHEYEITGVETTLGFCQFVMHHHAFRSGKFSTKFVEQYFKPEVLKSEMTDVEEMIASVLASELISSATQNQPTDVVQKTESKWKKNRA
ncbi:MAG: acetyl-CoA carboxylase biotin carboxylase subunit [Bacteroidetes bacterium]|nr:acetyl-CoA carboxylase biotin carboxylase subunit [Bacteroidota bacterium]MBS1541715.1 acetyl-CoA carboxylase biotin carboxylase subunit [Bacteroidota bacterium]